MTSLLAALTVKVSAILLLTLAGAFSLRRRSAAARHWVLAIGVASACVAPAIHVLPIPPVVRVASAEALAWSTGTMFEALAMRLHAPFTADAGAIGSVDLAERFVSRPGRSQLAVAPTAFADDVGRWAVTTSTRPGTSFGIPTSRAGSALAERHRGDWSGVTTAASRSSTCNRASTAST